MQRFISSLCLAAAIGLGATAPASAATAISVTAYKVGSVLESFTAFDPSLGTLTSVRFDISGQFQPLILSDSTGQVEPLFVTRYVDRIPGRGYATGFAAPIVGSIVTTSPGAPAAPIQLYINSFTFNAVSELTGFAIDSYGSTQVARLSDFLAGGPLGDDILEFTHYEAFALGLSGERLPSALTVLVGGGIVTYTYETRDVGGGVPEPASWALMIIGFGLAGAQMRRPRDKIRRFQRQGHMDSRLAHARRRLPSEQPPYFGALPYVGWNSSTMLPEGSSIRISLPPSPTTTSLRNRTPALRSRSTSPCRSGV